MNQPSANPSPPHGLSSPEESPGQSQILPRSSEAGGLLRLPLFWKIVLANVGLLAVGTAVGVGLSVGMGGPDSDPVTTTTILVGVLAISASVALNAALVRLALSPLAGLEDTARRVGRGETEARATDSALADRGLHRVTEVFNDMLDSLSANRLRQRELARRVLESEERERQLIAHELYSGTAQTLAGVLVRLRIAERHLTSGANGSIKEIREEVVSALEEIRGVARRLRPPELDELGVRVALEAHARSIAEGLRMDFRFRGEIPPLSREASLALFRIVQEAISNAALHSGADVVSVIFSSNDERVVAEVIDDGEGFDPGSALARTGRSLGLFGMHERAGYVQGELSLESGPGRGTCVRVEIPRVSELDTVTVNGTIDRLVDGLVDPEEMATTPTGADEGSSAPF